LIPQKSERDDIQVIYAPASDMATELGNVRLANVICLAALVKSTGITSVEAIERALEDHLPERHRKLLGMNKKAIRRGVALVGDVT
jgi:2-oxoglutarate ferredoxin oxidoreductase subunit gamma